MPHPPKILLNSKPKKLQLSKSAQIDHATEAFALKICVNQLNQRHLRPITQASASQ